MRVSNFTTQIKTENKSAKYKLSNKKTYRYKRKSRKWYLPELSVDGELLYLGGRGEVEAVAAVAEAERLRYPATPAACQRQLTTRRYKRNH